MYFHKLKFWQFFEAERGKMFETGTGRITSKNTVHQNINSAFNGGTVNYLKLCKKNLSKCTFRAVKFSTEIHADRRIFEPSKFGKKECYKTTYVSSRVNRSVFLVSRLISHFALAYVHPPRRER
jgi:hypothetical protein